MRKTCLLPRVASSFQLFGILEPGSASIFCDFAVDLRHPLLQSLDDIGMLCRKIIFF